MKPMKRDYLYNILESFEILAASRHPEKGKINGIKDEILKNHDNLMAEIDFFHTHYMAQREDIFRLTALNKQLLEALKEVAKGEGAFSRDPFEHACNCVDNMKAIAEAAIRAAEEK